MAASFAEEPIRAGKKLAESCQDVITAMGILDLIRGKKRPRTRAEPPRRRPGERGRGKTPAERIALAEARYLSQLERESPAEFRKLMHHRVATRLGMPQDDGELSQLARTVGQLKELGLINGGLGGGRESWIRDAVDGLRMLMQYQQPAAAATGSSNGTNGTFHVSEVQPPQPALPQADPATAQTPTVPPPPPPTEVVMTPMSQYLIAQLERKTPVEAAEWLISQNRREARQFVTGLCTTPDAEHAELLDRLAAEAPDLAAFVAWVRQHPEQMAATVQELRIRTKQFPSQLHPSQNVGM